MIRRLVLIAAAVLMTAAAPARPPVKAAAVPKAATVPKVPATPRPAAVRSSLDTTDPAGLIGVLNAAGAKAQVGSKAEDAVLVAVTSAAANFSAQFAGCDRQGRNCKAMLLDAPLAGTPTLAQLNGFNQSSALCRGYMDKAGKAHVTLSSLLFADDTREHAITTLAAWQGCIGDFGGFLKDPVGYLAAAP